MILIVCMSSFIRINWIVCLNAMACKKWERWLQNTQCLFVGIKDHLVYASLINPHLKHTQCPGT